MPIYHKGGKNPNPKPSCKNQLLNYRFKQRKEVIP